MDFDDFNFNFKEIDIKDTMDLVDSLLERRGWNFTNVKSLKSFISYADNIIFMTLTMDSVTLFFRYSRQTKKWDIMGDYERLKIKDLNEKEIEELDKISQKYY